MSFMCIAATVAALGGAEPLCWLWQEKQPLRPMPCHSAAALASRTAYYMYMDGISPPLLPAGSVAVMQLYPALRVTEPMPH